MLLKVINFEIVIEFMDQHIITKFGLPSTLMFDIASYFYGNLITEFALKIVFKIKYSANYYPQRNGLEESTKKNLLRIIKQTVDDTQRNWHKALTFSLWADRITYKASLHTSPYYLVYGKVVLPPNISLPPFALIQSIEDKLFSSIQKILSKVLKLEEGRDI